MDVRFGLLMEGVPPKRVWMRDTGRQDSVTLREGHVSGVPEGPKGLQNSDKNRNDFSAQDVIKIISKRHNKTLQIVFEDHECFKRVVTVCLFGDFENAFRGDTNAGHGRDLSGLSVFGFG